MDSIKEIKETIILKRADPRLRNVLSNYPSYGNTITTDNTPGGWYFNKNTLINDLMEDVTFPT